MNPRIETLSETKLVGKRIKMSMSDNKTVQLWQSFMPLRKTIKDSLTSDLFSMQVYDPSFDFRDFDPEAFFDKWAAVEVAGFDNVPDAMETYILEAGLYAVFLYKGAASGGPQIFRYIFETWLHASVYDPDSRPHFEILGEKYKNNDPESEEEIWIPIKPKTDLQQ